ncbi:hypothetical protein [Nocardia colli]|uniref:hypothetical protein n=1 Tax=Nocardia colli TaxID=2545717 RepID=UPI0035D68988
MPDTLYRLTNELIAQSVTISMPIAVNALLPGAGYIIGGAVGGVAAEMITGDIHNVGDVVRAAAVGAGGTLLGGGVGKSIAGRLVERRIDTIRNHFPFGAIPDQTVRRVLWNAKGNKYGSLAGSFLAHQAIPLEKWAEGQIVPTVDIGAGVLLAGMPNQLLMPGPGVLSPWIENSYRDTLHLLIDGWRQCGAGITAVAPRSLPPTVGTPQHSGMPTYDLAAGSTVTAAMHLHDLDTQLVDPVRQAGQNSAAIRAAIVDMMGYLNKTAPISPTAGTTQDEWTTGHLQHVTGAIHATILDGTKSAHSIGGRIEQLAPHPEVV